MPTYTYLCEIHDEEFEEVHSIKIVLEDCPICKTKGLDPHTPKRLIAYAAPGKMELSGNELKEKTAQDIKEMRHRSRTDEKYLANIVGESRFHKNQGGK